MLQKSNETPQQRGLIRTASPSIAQLKPTERLEAAYRIEIPDIVRPRLRPIMRAVLVFLALKVKHQDGSWVCWWKQAQIAEMTGFSIDSVGRALRELERLGVVEREARYAASGERTSDLISLTFPVDNSSDYTASSGNYSASSGLVHAANSGSSNRASIEQGKGTADEIRSDDFEDFIRLWPASKRTGARDPWDQITTTTPARYLTRFARIYLDSLNDRKFAVPAARWLTEQTWRGDVDRRATEDLERARRFGIPARTVEELPSDLEDRIAARKADLGLLPQTA